jgi:Na+/H+ antiporter NhaD/arsenite permease-like protein
MPQPIEHPKWRTVTLGEIIILASIITVLFQWFDQRARTAELEDEHKEEAAVFEMRKLLLSLFLLCLTPGSFLFGQAVPIHGIAISPTGRAIPYAQVFHWESRAGIIRGHSRLISASQRRRNKP